MKYRNIIFDFDGVLAESVSVKTQAFHNMFKQYGADVASKVVEHHKANGGMSRYEKFPFYHRQFLNTDLSVEEIGELSDQFSKMVVEGVINADEVKGTSWFLKKYDKRCKYWIVSATPENEIIKIADKRGIGGLFVKIYGSPKKKPVIVKKILTDHNISKNETVFLGDAMSDFEAADKNKIDFMLRSTSENASLFNNENIKRFTDFIELDKILHKE
jgi:phosphoglycolate phosphatase-like HAD superfamily hydrolase